MKVFVVILMFCVLSCGKNSQVQHPPVGGLLSQKDLEASRNRSKSLNENERKQIQNWISQQSEKYYPMAMNYWINTKNAATRLKKADGVAVNYKYMIYDFDGLKIYDKPEIKKNVQLGKFEDIKAVENAVRYLSSGEKATILVPSVLAFGTYGDNDKISNDTPLIIKIEVF